MTPWTPGAGARTIVPVEGMRVVERGVSGMTGKTGRVVHYTDHLSIVWEPIGGGTMITSMTGGAAPDLTDRATFLLALDELARRVGLDPAGGCRWRHQERHEMDLATHLAGWFLDVYGDRRFFEYDTADQIEALDRALFATAVKS